MVGIIQNNTKYYIKEYLKLRKNGYKFPKDELDIFKDINLKYIVGKDTKNILDELYSGQYISRLRYKLKLYDLTDEDIYKIIKVILNE